MTVKSRDNPLLLKQTRWSSQAAEVAKIRFSKQPSSKIIMRLGIIHLVPTQNLTPRHARQTLVSGGQKCQFFRKFCILKVNQSVYIASRTYRFC